MVSVGLTPRRSYLDIGPDSVRVRMGWAFQADLPRSSIVSVHRVEKNPYPGSFGAHGWRGRWLVNGAAGPLVSIELEPPVRARVARFPVRLRELLVSVEDPEGLVGRLGR